MKKIIIFSSIGAVIFAFVVWHFFFAPYQRFRHEINTVMPQQETLLHSDIDQQLFNQCPCLENWYQTSESITALATSLTTAFNNAGYYSIDSHGSKNKLSKNSLECTGNGNPNILLCDIGAENDTFVVGIYIWPSNLKLPLPTKNYYPASGEDAYTTLENEKSDLLAVKDFEVVMRNK